MGHAVRKETVYILPKQKHDRNGDPIGPVPEKIPVHGVVIWPRASEEKDGGEVNIDGENLKLPDTPITRALQSDGRMEIRGSIYSVDEPVARFAGKAVMVKTKRVRA